MAAENKGHLGSQASGSDSRFRAFGLCVGLSFE